MCDDDMCIVCVVCVAVMCFLVVLLMRFCSALVIWLIVVLSPLSCLGYTPFLVLITSYIFWSWFYGLVVWCLIGPHKCNTTTIQLQYKNFFLVLQLYCTCADTCNTTLQYQFSTACRKLAGYCSSCKKNLYCTVVLRLCGLLQYKKIFVLCYCSCIALVRTA